MQLESFRTSYAPIAPHAGALCRRGLLVAAGPFTLVMCRFKLESRWQLSERLPRSHSVSIPFSTVGRCHARYAMNRESGKRGGVEVAVLSHLILFLSAVKLFQRKHDRDWFFLYLISFFTVLLAAGLTASPIFLGVLILYLLCALSTIVAFEIQKARKKVTATQTRLLVPPDSTLFQKLPMRLWRRRYLETRRLPLVSVGLLILIVILALPFFLIAPRTAPARCDGGGRRVWFRRFFRQRTLVESANCRHDYISRICALKSSHRAPARVRWRGVALGRFTVSLEEIRRRGTV